MVLLIRQPQGSERERERERVRVEEDAREQHVFSLRMRGWITTTRR